MPERKALDKQQCANSGLIADFAAQKMDVSVLWMRKKGSPDSLAGDFRGVYKVWMP